MRYSIEPKDICNRIYVIYVKGYGFSSFAKNMGTYICNEFGQKPLESTKKSTTDAIKTNSKREIQKTAEENGDLIGNNKRAFQRNPLKNHIQKSCTHKKLKIK